MRDGRESKFSIVSGQMYSMKKCYYSMKPSLDQPLRPLLPSASAIAFLGDVVVGDDTTIRRGVLVPPHDP